MAIFKDEKCLWYADTEILAANLANKSVKEIQEILNNNDVIKLKSINRNSLKFYNRLSWVVLIPFFFILASTKWILTGDFYLDSWLKKSKILNYLYNFTGVR